MKVKGQDALLLFKDFVHRHPGLGEPVDMKWDTFTFVTWKNPLKTVNRGQGQGVLLLIGQWWTYLYSEPPA